MTHGSLFSGIGGFDLAAEWMGWENAFHCEWNPFGQRVLKYYWPNATSYEDITKTDFTIWRGRIDVLTGGFPCQDLSVSSSNGRYGLEGNKSSMWWHMLRAIKEIRPRFVVCENVYGLLTQGNGSAIDAVLQGLRDEGYKVSTYVLPASAFGANHRRKRTYIVAYAPSIRNRIPKGKVQAGRDITQHCAGWNTEPSVSRVHDGVSVDMDGIAFSAWRKETHRSYGNAIVPQVAHQIFKAIEEFESNER